MDSLLKEKSVVIVTYTHKEEGKPTYMAGPPQDLKTYLLERQATLYFIEQPISYSDDPTATAEYYEQGKLVKQFKFPMFRLPKKMRRPDIDSNPLAYILFKTRDVLSTLYFFLKVRKKFDVYFGVEAVNAMLGLFFRLIRSAKVVVYDIIDYSPVRFPNKVLNKIYHTLDNLCVKRCDASWVQTQRIIDHRKTKGLPPDKQWVKPTGVHLSKVGGVDYDQIKPHQVIYVGGFYDRDGSELLVESLPLICSTISDLNLLMVGHGDRREEVKKMVSKMGYEKNVKFLGTVSDPEKVDALIKESAIGLAPYKEDLNSLKTYNDTAKPKLYLSLGIPVVMTRSTLFSEELNQEQAGFAVSFDKQEWAKAIVQLLQDEAKLKTFRANALKLAKKYSWDQIFDRLFEPIWKKV